MSEVSPTRHRRSHPDSLSSETPLSSGDPEGDPTSAGQVTECRSRCEAMLCEHNAKRAAGLCRPTSPDSRRVCRQGLRVDKWTSVRGQLFWDCIRARMPRSLTVSAWRVHVGMSTCKHAHMKIVAVVNQKGGVGKTATVLGLASAAAQEPSRRTLIVDLDPQANATAGLGVEGGEFTTGDVLFADAKGVAADAITKTAWGDGVPCIPANLALAERDVDVSLGSEFRLRKALAGVEGFDLVLIDCPPSIGRLVTNGLVAADHALVVTQAAAPSLMGVANVMATVDVVSEHYNPGLAVAGIVVNLLPPRQREADYRLAELVEAFGTTVWEPYVPARAVVSEAQGASAPIHDFASRGRDVASVYEALVARVMTLGTG